MLEYTNTYTGTLYRTVSSMAYPLPLLVFSIIPYPILPTVISAEITIHSMKEKEQRGEKVSQTLPLFFFFKEHLALAFTSDEVAAIRITPDSQHHMTLYHLLPFISHVVWITLENSGICSLLEGECRQKVTGYILKDIMIAQNME